MKYDSCGIWSIGPIEHIVIQGPSRHAMTAAVWPRLARGTTPCGYPTASYNPRVPVDAKVVGLMTRKAKLKGKDDPPIESAAGGGWTVEPEEHEFAEGEWPDCFRDLPQARQISNWLACPPNSIGTGERTPDSWPRGRSRRARGTCTTTCPSAHTSG